MDMISMLRTMYSPECVSRCIHEAQLPDFVWLLRWLHGWAGAVLTADGRHRQPQAEIVSGDPMSVPWVAALHRERKRAGWTYWFVTKRTGPDTWELIMTNGNNWDLLGSVEGRRPDGDDWHHVAALEGAGWRR